MFVSNHRFQYVALGDSITAGIGTILFHPDFVDWYYRFAETALKTPIDVAVFAHSGATIQELVGLLKRPMTQEAIKRAEIITITAGGNDLIDAAKHFLMSDNVQTIENRLSESQTYCHEFVETIHRLKTNASTPYIIRSMNLYNPFPQIKVVDDWVRKFNNHLETCFGTGRNAKVADVYSLFKGHEREWIKGIHPNETGYYEIAKALDKLGYEPLS